jgi:hypothetical protein
MSKTVNVRVAKSKLVKALKEALDRKVKEAETHKEAEKAQKKAIDDIKKSVASLVKSGKLTPTEVSFPYSYRNYETEYKQVTVTFSHKITIPKLDSDYNEHKNNEAQNDLQNAIRVLELSDEEYVRTSSYGAVSKYL